MSTLNKLVRAAVLTALSVVMTRLLPTSAAVAIFGLSPLTVRFALGLIPIYIAAIMLGPAYGAGVAAIADIIGYLINPMGGAYLFPFTLTAALGAAICGLLTKREDNSLLRIALAVYVSAVVTSFLNTFLVSWLYSLGFFTVLVPRTISTVVMCIIYVAVVWLLLKIFSRTDRKSSRGDNT